MDNRDQLITKHKNKAGFKSKIIAKCIECLYDPVQKGSWRQQVQSCTSPKCPLFAVRPMQLGDKTKNLCNGIPEKITA